MGTIKPMNLTLYSKPGCHLCEGLQEKLQQVQGAPHHLQFTLEIRDITTMTEWFNAYQYEIPVLCLGDQTLPRLSPRADTAQLAKLLQPYLNG
jgi:Glutaredoxin-like domain (DUF836)